MEREKLVKTVTLAQSGDSDALNELFNAFYNDVYYFALKNVKDEDLACDITQEAFVEIINTLGDLKEPAAFVTWMKQITYHQCTRYFKKKKEVLVDENEDGDTIFDTMVEERSEFIPDEAVDQVDFRTTIMGMIDQLPDEQRSATMMYYFDEMSVKEIAQAQGVGENTVKGRLSYSRKAIKKSVEDYEKKNNVKLHCVGLLPLLLWLFQNYGKAMSVVSAKAVAEGVSTATGVGICVAAGSGAVTATVTTTATVGIGAKIAAIPLTAKIGAGILAVAMVAGIGTAVVIGIQDKETPTETTENTKSHIHNYTATTVDATCTEDGEVVYTCVCGDSYSEIITATGHNYTLSKTEATCTADGKTFYTCSCGDSYIETVAASGHSWGEWKVYKEATTDAEGESRRTCANCKEYESKSIAKLPAVENIFFNENNNYYDANAVSIKPRYVYWEDGKLIAECFVINGFNYSVFNINVKSLSFNNGSVDIASASFGTMNDIVLAPYTHVIWRFEFPADCVSNYGADLSTLNCVYKVGNNY